MVHFNANCIRLIFKFSLTQNLFSSGHCSTSDWYFNHCVSTEAEAGTRGVLQPHFSGVSDLQLFKKRRFRHRCFPVNSAQFLRTPSLQNTSGGCIYRGLFRTLFHFCEGDFGNSQQLTVADV